jgi:hypothetical protein
VAASAWRRSYTGLARRQSDLHLCTAEKHRNPIALHRNAVLDNHRTPTSSELSTRLCRSEEENDGLFPNLPPAGGGGDRFTPPIRGTDGDQRQRFFLGAKGKCKSAFSTRGQEFTQEGRNCTLYMLRSVQKFQGAREWLWLGLGQSVAVLVIYPSILFSRFPPQARTTLLEGVGLHLQCRRIFTYVPIVEF